MDFDINLISRFLVEMAVAETLILGAVKIVAPRVSVYLHPGGLVG